MREIIATSTGKLGDALYILPVASWLARTRGVKIHFVLPRCFGPFRYIENLLMLQPFVSRVTLVDHPIKNFDCGGQPWEFDPAQYGIVGEYYNFGFPRYPDKFLSAFYAELHGFDYDRDFHLNYYTPGTCLHPTEERLRTSESAMTRIRPDLEQLPTAIDLLDLTRRLASAQEVHSWFCGIAVLCWFADIDAHVYRVPGHASTSLYFPDARSLIFHELERIPEAAA